MPDQNYGKGFDLCLNCGKRHGSVNLHILCLEDGIRKLRFSVQARLAECEKLVQQMETIQKSALDYYKYPMARGGMYAEMAKGRK